MSQDQTYVTIIKKLIEECGMTREDIAREGGFSLQSIYNWEDGSRLPQPTKRETLRKMARNHKVAHSESNLDLTLLEPEQRDLLNAIYDYLMKEVIAKNADSRAKSKDKN